MPRVFLFGAWRQLVATNPPLYEITRPANLAIQGPWSSTFNEQTGAATLNATLIVRNLYRVRLKLVMRFAELDHTGDWRLTPSQPNQSSSWLQIHPVRPDPQPIITLLLEWGPLVRAHNLSSVGIGGGEDLRILFSPVAVTANADLPLSIQLTGHATLDLEQLSVSFGADAFSARTYALANVPGSAVPILFFERRLTGDAVRLALDQNPQRMSLTFRSIGDEAIALHVDPIERTSPPSAENPLVAPVAISDVALSILVERSPNQALRLCEVTAAGRGSPGPILTTESWRDAANDALSWQVDRALNLHLRCGSGQKPATLLTAPDLHGAADYPALTALAPAGNFFHGHLHEARHTFGASFRLHSPRRLATANPPIDALLADLASDATTPWFVAENDTETHVAKSGHTYATDANASVVVHEFTARLRMPLFPPTLLRQSSAAIEDDYLNDLAPAVAPTYNLTQSVHESLMLEGPVAGGTQVPLSRLFRKSQSLLQPAEPEIAEHELSRDYVAVKVVRQEQTSDIDYAVIRDPDDLESLVPQIDLTAGDGQISVTMNPVQDPAWPLALVKLTRRLSLEEISEKAGLDLDQLDVGGLNFLREVVHPAISHRDWTGLILFNLPVSFGDFPILKRLMGEANTEIGLAYLAIAPTKDGMTSYTGRIRYLNDDATDPGESAEESRLRPNIIDIAWFDSSLLSFKVELELTFVGFLGLDHEEHHERTLIIDGALDAKTGTIRFLGRLTEPLKVLPPTGSGFGPIKQVLLRGAEIVSTESDPPGEPPRVTIQIDGTIEPQPFDLGGISLGTAIESISFDRLGLDLPVLGGANPKHWRWLKINYPSLRLDLNLPSMSLGAVALKLQSLGIGLGNFAWGKSLIWRESATVPAVGSPEWLKSLLFRIRLDMMRLPELAIASFDRLSLDFTMAMPPIGDAWTLPNLRVAIGAVGFDNFELDLMRFLQLKARSVALEQVTYDDPNSPGTSVTSPWLKFVDVELRILGKEIVDGMTLVIFTTNEGQTGFLCYLPQPVPALGMLQIHWILIGQNLSIHQSLAERLLSIDAKDTIADNQQIRDDILAAVDPKTLSIVPGRAGGIGDWIFAGGFSIFGDFLFGKLLFQDRRYYGIALRGGLLKRIFGYDFAISVLYVKAATPAEDRFIVSVRVPTVVLPAFTFFGGVVTFDIALNGSFLIDVGFPRLRPDGSREWDRCFGTIVGYFQGSGGIYLAKRTTSSSVIGNELTLAGGYAVQFGLGASFGGGVFRAWVTIGLYGILEGSFTFRTVSGDTKLQRLRLVGAVGILVRGVGELDWWVISVRVEILASAEARTTLAWEDGQQTTITFDFNLTVRASAEACIGSGYFSVCRGIDVSLSIPFQRTLALN